MNYQHQTMEADMSAQDVLNEGTKRINRVEDDLRWLLSHSYTMQQSGVGRDCTEKTALHLSKALDFTKRGHKCIQDGVTQSTLRGPNKDDD